MNQSKATSWASATFIIGLSAALLVPLAYIAAIGKVEAQAHLGISSLQIFDVVSHASGKFYISYGIGAIIVPAILSLLVWMVLSAVLHRSHK